MPSKIFSATNVGLDSHLIEVEADISASNPNFLIVGLPDAAVSEAKERVRSAIKNSDMLFPRTKITVNLAPADLKKFGPSFDLPIAIAVLNCQVKGLKLKPEDKRALFIGELSLDGTVKPINGILSIAAGLKQWKIKRVYLPQENAAEAALIQNLEIFPVDNLSQLILHLKDKEKIRKFSGGSNFSFMPNDDFNLGEIKGQQQAKRALVITAAGYHNLLLQGPPGSGKTLLSRALANLLPPLSLEESLEVTKIYSLIGQLKKGEPLVIKRPFRSPHHTSSGIALIGGGSFPHPGEITLAHRGILFLDEFPEFPRNVLENLRQPLEDGLITVSRAQTSVTFPARFTLVAAMNPCPCGYLGDTKIECSCSVFSVENYQKKISGPIMDRIDLRVNVPRLTENELTDKTIPEDMEKIKKQIKIAQEKQFTRLKKYNLFYNSEMNYRLVEKLCDLDPESEKLLKEAIGRLQLSARSYHKILKVARTIADLDNSEKIKTAHLAESLQYR